MMKYNFALQESVKLELKKAKNSLPDDVWPTYSAFANTMGGTIVLGVEEKPANDFKIVGVDNPTKIIDDFWNTITSEEKVSSNILSDSNVIVDTIDGKTVIVIEVPEASYGQKPILVKTKNRKQMTAYKRLGTADKIATPEQIVYMYSNNKTDMDSDVIDGYDIDDLNISDVRAYKSEVLNITKQQRYSEISDEEFLKEIGAFKKKRPCKEYGLTIGGLLFFGKYQSIRDYYPAFQLDYFKKDTNLNPDWQDRISSGDISYPDMNVYSFYNLALKKMTDNIAEAFVLDENARRKPYRSDLTVAIRETLVNMLMHAYYGADVPLKIIETPDYIEFYNPGDMRISREEFIIGGTSKQRNSTISVLFRKVGIAEKAGSGGPRIFDIVNQYSLKIPDITSTDIDTTIRIWKTNFLSTLDKFDEKEQRILEFIVATGKISKSNALGELKLTEYAYTKAIKSLLNQEIISQRGNRKSTHYILKTNTEASTFSDQKFLKDLEDMLRNKAKR
ncbi:RNA-binding domain-containing protein [Lactococcus petauri]